MTRPPPSSPLFPYTTLFRSAAPLQIGPPPVQRNWLPRGLRLQRVEALLRGRVGTAVETVVVERQAEELDLGARGGALRLGHAPQDARPDQGGEQAQHDDHDEDLDQREAAGTFARAPHMPSKLRGGPR